MSKNIVEPVSCKVLDVRNETDQEVTFRVAADFDVTHGQFLQLSIPKIGEAPISISSFGPGYLEFTIRAVGRVTDRLFALKPGDTLFLRGAYGNGWPLDKLKGKHLVVISGGTGIAPVRSLLQMAASDRDFFKSVYLVAGFRAFENVMFKEELKSFRTSFNCLYTLYSEDAEGFERGFANDHLDHIPFLNFGEDYNVIIVGSPTGMSACATALTGLNIPDEKMWLSFERKMSCAVGKCGHCRIDEVYVCLDGPVFNYTVAKNLID
jgi:anaerobic sulfite reductase subunit B